MGLEEVHLLNGQTNFSQNFKGNLVLEDGVVANYESLITRAKVI
jgi:hypothetical protein